MSDDDQPKLRTLPFAAALATAVASNGEQPTQKSIHDDEDAETYRLHTMDLPFPGENDQAFGAVLPQPAKFLRAYSLVKPAKLKGAQAEVTLRIVWLVNARTDAEMKEQVYVIASIVPAKNGLGFKHNSMRVKNGSPKPVFCDLVADPRNGLPISIHESPGLQLDPPRGISLES